MLAVQKKLYQENQLTAFDVAETEALLDDQPAALRYLRLSLAQNEGVLAYARTSAYFRKLRSNPEFQQLIRDAGLPPLT